MHTKGDFPLSHRGPPWPRSPRRCDSTTATVLLADGMVRPSRASKHIDVVWAKRTAKMILEVLLRHTRQEDTPTLWYASEGRLPLKRPRPTAEPQLPSRRDSATVTVPFADGMVRPSRASEHVDASLAKRTINTILEASLRRTRQEDGFPL